MDNEQCQTRVQEKKKNAENANALNAIPKHHLNRLNMSCVYVFRLVISCLNKAHTKNGEKIVYRCNKQSSEITGNTAKPLVKGLKQLNKNRYNCLIY